MGTSCITTGSQSNSACGLSGAACSSCGSSQSCTAGSCITQTGAGVGGACSNGTDCGGDTCKTLSATGNITYPGGSCTRTCTTSSSCGTGAGCFTLTGYETGGLCLKRCTTAADCRAGYDCYQFSAGVNACWVANQPATRIGSACTTDSACQNPPTFGGVCQTQTLSDGGLSGFTGGYCFAYCSSSRDCSADGGATCYDVGFTNGGLCYQNCTVGTSGRCRAGYVCQPLAVGSTAGTCDPDCNNPGGRCPVGKTCQASGLCQ